MNRHKNTIIFVASFIFCEDALSFEWFFEEFLKCMGTPPLTIITDQDEAMRSDLGSKMPNTFHKLYKWYITNKKGDKVGKVYQDYDAMNAFHDIVNNLVDATSFEAAWQSWL